MIVLKSGGFSASIKTFGAELCSIKNENTGDEYMWQAGESWSRHAPVLFPFVGRCKDFEYRWKGQSYTIEQHGFARDLPFMVEAQTENQVVLKLTDSAHTLQRYPFRFEFRVIYQLEQNCLSMGFETHNKNSDEMPVSFGGHPAFAILNPEDALIEFENDLNPPSYLLDDSCISNRTKFVTNGQGVIEVNAKTFDEDALIFRQLKSKWVFLKSRSSSKTVKVSLEGWPYLGIWAKPNANFICLEPWQGLADLSDFSGPVNTKEGIVMVAANGSISRVFNIEVGS